MKPKITKLYAFIMDGEDGYEYIAPMFSGHHPAVTAAITPDLEKIAGLRVLLGERAKEYRLLEFELKGEVSKEFMERLDIAHQERVRIMDLGKEGEDGE